MTVLQDLLEVKRFQLTTPEGILRLLKRVVSRNDVSIRYTDDLIVLEDLYMQSVENPNSTNFYCYFEDTNLDLTQVVIDPDLEIIHLVYKTMESGTKWKAIKFSELSKGFSSLSTDSDIKNIVKQHQSVKEIIAYLKVLNIKPQSMKVKLHTSELLIPVEGIYVRLWINNKKMSVTTAKILTKPTIRQIVYTVPMHLTQAISNIQQMVKSFNEES